MADEVISHIGDSVHSIISEGSRLKGDFEVKGLLRIDGDFSGSITTDGKVLVSRNGRAACTINGNIVVIGGVFKGTIIAHNSVEILSSAVVIGTILSPRLIVHEHVILHGSCRITPDAERFRHEVRRLEEAAEQAGAPSVALFSGTRQEKVPERVAQ